MLFLLFPLRFFVVLLTLPTFSSFIDFILSNLKDNKYLTYEICLDFCLSLCILCWWIWGSRTVSRSNTNYFYHYCFLGPVREVDIEFSDDSVTCRAQGIYPAPTLTWSTDPPIDTRLLQSKTKTQKNQRDFYNIQSSLMLTQKDDTNQTFICCVTSDTNKKTAFLKHEGNEVWYLWCEDN